MTTSRREALIDAATAIEKVAAELRATAEEPTDPTEPTEPTEPMEPTELTSIAAAAEDDGRRITVKWKPTTARVLLTDELGDYSGFHTGGSRTSGFLVAKGTDYGYAAVAVDAGGKPVGERLVAPIITLGDAPPLDVTEPPPAPDEAREPVDAGSWGAFATLKLSQVIGSDGKSSGPAVQRLRLDRTKLEPRSGDVLVTKRGAVVSDLDIKGRLIIDADDVEVRRVRSESSRAGNIVIQNDRGGITINEVELDGKGTSLDAIRGGSYEVDGVLIVGQQDGLRPHGKRRLLQVHRHMVICDLALIGSFHADGMQVFLPTNAEFYDSFIVPNLLYGAGPNKWATSAVMHGLDFSTEAQTRIKYERVFFDLGRVNTNYGGGGTGGRIPVTHVDCVWGGRGQYKQATKFVKNQTFENCKMEDGSPLKPRW